MLELSAGPDGKTGTGGSLMSKMKRNMGWARKRAGEKLAMVPGAGAVK